MKNSFYVYNLILIYFLALKIAVYAVPLKSTTPQFKSELNFNETAEFGSVVKELLGLINELGYIIDHEPSFNTHLEDTYPRRMLSEAAVSVTGLHRRGYPSVRPKCQASKAKVQGLKTTIDRALQNITMFENEPNCDYDENLDTNNCAEMFKLIQCGISHLANAYYKSLATSSLSLSEQKLLQNTLEELNEENRRQINELKSSMTSEYQSKLEKMQQNFDKITLKLKETVQKYETVKVELCVFKIFNQHTEEAATLFSTEIQSIEKLENIITRSYNMLPKGVTDNTAKIENYEKIMKFVFHLGSMDYILLGFAFLELEHQAKQTANAASSNLPTNHLLILFYD